MTGKIIRRRFLKKIIIVLLIFFYWFYYFSPTLYIRATQGRVLLNKVFARELHIMTVHESRLEDKILVIGEESTWGSISQWCSEAEAIWMQPWVPLGFCIGWISNRTVSGNLKFMIVQVGFWITLSSTSNFWLTWIISGFNF